MRAVCWHGTEDVRVETVPDPEIVNPRDAIIKVTSTAICGSDLHLYNGFVPTMQKDDILGHEFMGEIVELGSSVKNLKVGDRVVVPFTISCGNCLFCRRDLYSLCDNSNPNVALAEKFWGHTPCGIFGYSHLVGGYSGGQAEYVRVPYADVGPMKVPEHLHDDQVLFLTDIFPTGYMAAENCNIQPDDTVAVWGCGPVGQFTIASAFMLGAARVIAIDEIPERLEMARRQKAETVDLRDLSSPPQLVEKLKTMTHGRGPDACIDAVGMEGHGLGIEHIYDRAKQIVRFETDRPAALRQALMSCRKGGTVSVPGVYGGIGDKLPLGSLMNKSLTVRTGQTHVQHYLKPLLERVEKGEIDPSFVISHRLPLEEAANAYRMFRDKSDHCTKVVMRPGLAPESSTIAQLRGSER
ncbi:zinc-dependent alcohol dehydrogenase [Marinobacter nanhaiticus D15-8W]|uniref:Glutathione-dependent formaldehyde dehydrogenase n=1 Tax=Marinobacter nanhaiticus D15-8W TaxID=626887 RepID=N6X1I0_9GAMM|nr:zinc-dependent alcohol dehydrogenase [Marinobacter nanhaiticus]ENO14948.1 glutathione-dependent formaldehyde dehydrogenase [Marinobacter nanhaiticus D15-8W]BES69356.1 zinc-dependent alcohol dehydrogenase [Marinobacter nanhaiticus D15-8W]